MCFPNGCMISSLGKNGSESNHSSALAIKFVNAHDLFPLYSFFSLEDIRVLKTSLFYPYSTPAYLQASSAALAGGDTGCQKSSIPESKIPISARRNWS